MEPEGSLPSSQEPATPGLDPEKVEPSLRPQILFL
jgi:hypothetical protein